MVCAVPRFRPATKTTRWTTPGAVMDPPAQSFVARPLTIGSLVVDPPLLQAPMAGFTNYVYRQIVREYGGAGLQATEMISAAAEPRRK